MGIKVKRISVILLALAFLTPVGILLPYWLNGGDAWGEWSTDTLKEKIGYVPSGMKKIAEIWNSPITDYSLNDNQTIVRQSVDYILSAVIGLIIIASLSFLLYKFVRKQ
jgi:hypothetical protein